MKNKIKNQIGKIRYVDVLLFLLVFKASNTMAAGRFLPAPPTDIANNKDAMQTFSYLDYAIYAAGIILGVTCGYKIVMHCKKQEYFESLGPLSGLVALSIIISLYAVR